MNDVLVFVPTYNEKDNIISLYRSIKSLSGAVDILFIDDASPDGIGCKIDQLVKKDKSVSVIHRSKKLGLGTAHKKAFSYACKKKYPYLLTMDADFTHNPQYIPTMIQNIKTADLVIGSRYIKGGAIPAWSSARKFLTYAAHACTKYCLGMPYDCTGAFRLYRTHIFSSEWHNDMVSEGYSFMFESLYRIHQYGYRIKEIPIIARDRSKGESKIARHEIIRAVERIMNLFCKRMWNQAKRLVNKELHG